MTPGFGANASNESARHHPLLGGWWDVIDDVRRLASELRHSPGRCAYGHSASGPDGKCPRCQAQSPHLDFGDCAAQIDAFSVKLDALIDHTVRYLPALADILRSRAAAEESEQVKSVRAQLGTVSGTLRRLVTATAEFRRGCGDSHLRSVAPLADDLLSVLWTLEERLEPGTKRWAELRIPPGQAPKR